MSVRVHKSVCGKKLGAQLVLEDWKEKNRRWWEARIVKKGRMIIVMSKSFFIFHFV